MSAGKRKASTPLSGSPSKQVRTPAGPSAAQPGSSPQQSSQHSMFSPDRSVGAISNSEKTHWRDLIDDPDKFFAWLEAGEDDGPEWPESAVHALRDSWIAVRQEGFNDFIDFLFNAAQLDLCLIRDLLLKDPEFRDAVRWSALPLEDEQLPADQEMDNLMYCWLLVKKLHAGFTKHWRPRYAEVLGTLLPPRSEQLERLLDVAAVGFRRPGKTTQDGQRPTDAVYKQILQFYQGYKPNQHMAPYTSIIGPSGIGKSFAVAELARHHGLYVVYASLARSDSAAYPQRSAIAAVLPHDLPREDQVRWWQCFVVVGLHVVQACREIGISPADFYDLQVITEYQGFQVPFAKLVKELASSFRTPRTRGEGGVGRGLQQLAKQRVGTILGLMRSWKTTLVDTKNQPRNDPVVAPSDKVPSAIICLDEARALLEGADKSLFRSFRAALDRCWYYRSSSDKEMGELHAGQFFAVLLDTMSKVANFSPPVAFDPSQKTRRPDNSGPGSPFPPIWRLDTMDLEGLGDQHPDGSEEAVLNLFRLGRPLWNDWVDEAQSPKEIGDFASQKLSTHNLNSARALAILSCRIDFYVLRQSLAEELVAGCMRYVYYINEARDLLRTIQPSEPVLAHQAARAMQSLDARKDILRHFASACFEGSVHTGDLGEMTIALVILLAFDEALFKGVNSYIPMAIALRDFMTEWLGPAAVAKISAAIGRRAGLKRFWEEGEVFCNHLGRLQEPPTEHSLFAAFNRGMGILLPDNFPGCDIVIPVKIAKETMSFIVISVKNRSWDTPGNSLNNLAKSSVNAAVKQLSMKERPYFGMTVALRTKSTELQADKKFTIVEKPTSTKAKKNSKANANRLIMLAVGFDDDVYPVASKCSGVQNEETKEVMQQLGSLLTARGLLSLPKDIENDSYFRRLMPLGSTVQQPLEPHSGAEQQDAEPSAASQHDSPIPDVDQELDESSEEEL